MDSLDSVRDWGCAPEYAEGMWRMLQPEGPEDRVRFFPRFLRPTEMDQSIGDASKAGTELRWEAEVLTSKLARIIVDADSAQLMADPMVSSD